jgi:hypothetical protein
LRVGEIFVKCQKFMSCPISSSWRCLWIYSKKQSPQNWFQSCFSRGGINFCILLPSSPKSSSSSVFLSPSLSSILLQFPFFYFTND